MTPMQKRKFGKIVVGLFALSLVAVVGLPWVAHAVDEGSDPAMAAAEGEAASGDACCKAGDQTPPGELVKLVAPGGLHSPYPDYAKMAKDDPDLVKQFRLPGCNECHGGGGGGGMCPALSQGIWFWGNTDDVLFRLVTLGSAELEKSGFVRYQYGSVHAPMPPMAVSIKTADHLWKIIAFIRSINPPGTNPPEKVIPGRLREGDAPH
jgi:mono/diheme cytochrome c family protein